MRTLSAGQIAGTAAVVIAFAAGAGISGCVSHPPPGAQVGDGATITEDEIDSAHVSTAYDVIHKLRPQFLISRGKLSLDPTAPPALPRVYVDGQFYGDATTLRGILTLSIESIHYYSGSAAQYKFGHDNAAGVIAIATKH
jgi:hypothetical protein